MKKKLTETLGILFVKYANNNCYVINFLTLHIKYFCETEKFKFS